MEDMRWTHRTMIIPIALAEPARAACMALTGSASEGLFTRPMYSEGNPEPTHAISSGLIAGDFASILPCVEYTITEEGTEVAIESEGNIAILLMKLADAEFNISIEELQIMLEHVYVSKEDGLDAIKRLNLSFFAPEESTESNDFIV